MNSTDSDVTAYRDIGREQSIESSLRSFVTGVVSIKFSTMLLFLTSILLFSCSSNHFIGRHTIEEPIFKECVIREYYPSFGLNHWIVLQDSIGQYLYISQPGRYPNKLFVSRVGDNPYEIYEPIRGKKQLFLGDKIQIALYKYKDHPNGFHAAERSCHRIGLGNRHTIRTENGWVDNIYYCPDIELINELIYINDH